MNLNKYAPKPDPNVYHCPRCGDIFKCGTTEECDRFKEMGMCIFCKTKGINIGTKEWKEVMDGIKTLYEKHRN